MLTPDATVTYKEGAAGKDLTKPQPEGLLLTYTAANPLNATTWWPGAPTTGNLFGTFRTLDNLGGYQDLNCSVHTPFLEHGEPEVCTFGLVSRSGVAAFDDALSPVLTDGWVQPQTAGFCGVVPPAAQLPCFGAGVPNNPTDVTACTQAGCCWSPADATCTRRGGTADHYVFVHGVEYGAALADFAKIAGFIPIPQRHFLGLSWSLWNETHTSADTRAQVSALRNLSVGVTAYTFDMNWHKRPNWTGYSWDAARYPDHPQLLQDLRADGLHMGVNLHDAEGVMSLERRYAAMAAANGVDPASGDTVAFHIDDKRFAESLSEVVLRPLAAEGLSYWWTDWQQGVQGVQDVAGLDTTMWLNHFRFTNASGSGVRGLIHSRFGGLGGHRYPTGFGGDVLQTYDSLAYMVYFTATASNVLFAYWGQELMQNGSDHRLFTRVVQFGAWSPVATFWGNVYGSDDRLWLLPEPYHGAVVRALQDRAMMMPYRYTLAAVAHATSVGMLRPMYYSHPWLDAAYDDSRGQYMFGPDVLVAPVTTPGDASTAWLPPDTEWVPFRDPTGTCSATPIVGTGVNVTLPANISHTPVLVRRGAVVPMLSLATATALGGGARPFSNMEWALFLGPLTGAGAPRSAAAWVYEDDGMSEGYLREEFANTSAYVSVAAGTTVAVKVSTLSLYPGMATNKQHTVVVKGQAPRGLPTRVTVMGAVAQRSPTYPPPPGNWSTDGCDVAVAAPDTDARDTVHVTLTFSSG